jgi:hypothetical protein
MNYPPVSPEQMDALRAFAEYEGPGWKDRLWTAWMRASVPGYLHQLRNSHGPVWLQEFEFPEVVLGRALTTLEGAQVHIAQTDPDGDLWGLGPAAGDAVDLIHDAWCEVREELWVARMGFGGSRK